ncbi:MAG TPA: hypothetical protein VE338_10500 [Ktedonobacterales bacterium]|nr:hypothetical protein [Ktedonobacterales bacterium]
MTDDRDDDLRDRPVGEEQLGDEEVSEGRDVHDLTRTGQPHGVDVTTTGEQPGIESRGETVIDRTHAAESRGVDVIDEGPVTPGEGESELP